MSSPTGDSPPSADSSTGQLVSSLTEQITTLVRQELQLAQAEMRHKAKGAGAGAGMLGSAGVLALYGVAALLTTAIAALALVLEVWLAALIVALVVLATAGIVALVGKKRVSDAMPATPDRTIENLKQDLAAVKGETA